MFIVFHAAAFVVKLSTSAPFFCTVIVLSFTVGMIGLLDKSGYDQDVATGAKLEESTFFSISSISFAEFVRFAI